MNRRYRKILSILILLLLLFVAGWFFLLSAAGDLSDRLALLETETAARYREAENKVALKRILEQTQADRLKLLEYFVSDETAVNFIEAVERIGRTTGTVAEVSAVVPGDKGLGLAVKAKGSFAGVYRFLELLEKMPRALLVDRVTLTTVDAGTEAKPGVAWQADIALTLLKAGAAADANQEAGI